MKNVFAQKNMNNIGIILQGIRHLILVLSVLIIGLVRVLGIVEPAS